MTRNFKEQPVTVNSKVNIKGTLTIPNEGMEKYPAVLLISGSGPVDRNGNIKKAKLNLNMYKDLTEIITDAGFITLRYDKRGVGESEGEFKETGMWDLVDDAEACVKFLKEYPQVDSNKVVVLGHSEGCMLGTALNARYPVDGLVLLSGAAETLEEALQRQRDLVKEEINSLKGFKGFLLRLFNVAGLNEKQAKKFNKKIMESTSSTIKVAFQTINAKWFREHFNFNVFDALNKVTCPVLAVTGSKDVQANPEKLKNIPDLVAGEYEYHVIENMNHGLKEQKGNSSLLNFKKEYMTGIDKPIHPDLVNVLINWLKKHFDN